MNEITPEDVGEFWPVALPLHLHGTAHGTNNRSFVVDSGGNRFFLKAFDNEPDRGRLLFESRLTTAIAGQHPSFGVPEPIPARSGETHLLVAGRYYALMTFIPGTAAGYGDPDDATACGRALGELHVVLDQVELDIRDAELRVYDDLSMAYPLVPEP